MLLGVHFRDRHAAEPGGAGARLRLVTETPRATHVSSFRTSVQERQIAAGAAGGLESNNANQRCAACSPDHSAITANAV